ncbi:hypothetical protein JD76_06515 [Micromonospora endolithica]|nr:hypothetical protein JD76_06515 [Micromonospora endolithica]
MVLTVGAVVGTGTARSRAARGGPRLRTTGTRYDRMGFTTGRQVLQGKTSLHIGQTTATAPPRIRTTSRTGPGRAGPGRTRFGEPEAGQTDPARRAPGERTPQRLAAGRPRTYGSTRTGADPRAPGDRRSRPGRQRVRRARSTPRRGGGAYEFPYLVKKRDRAWPIPRQTRRERGEERWAGSGAAAWRPVPRPAPERNRAHATPGTTSSQQPGVRPSRRTPATGTPPRHRPQSTTARADRDRTPAASWPQTRTTIAARTPADTPEP